MTERHWATIGGPARFSPRSGLDEKQWLAGEERASPRDAVTMSARSLAACLDWMGWPALPACRRTPMTESHLSILHGAT